jgi:cell division septation protein DedD
VETPIKHRITGAIILVALIVVLVPEMLSGPRAPQVSAPASSIALPTPGNAPTAPLRSIDIDVAEREPGRVSLPAASSAPPSAAQAAPAAVTPPVTAPAPAAVDSYVVQVGSFASRMTADALAATLRTQGFAPTVSPVQAGERTLHRVRVGPAGERAAAEALRARLRKAGHAGSVVAGP